MPAAWARAYAAIGSSDDNLSGLEKFGDTLSFLRELRADIQMNEESSDNVEKRIAASYIARLFAVPRDIG